MAVAIWVFEQILDAHMAEVNTLVEQSVTGTSRWLRDQALAFQYGDSLIYNSTTKVYEYPTIIPANQIVSRAAVVEVGGQARIKIGKTSGGTIIPITAPELSAFQDYINLIQFAGTNVVIINLSADLFKVAYDVTYDPLIMNPDGTLISDGTTRPVDVAITNAVSDLSTLENFNGTLNLTALTDAVQRAAGVLDPVITLAEAKPAAGVYITINKNYNSDAGHLAIDPAFPLLTQITYTAG